MSEIEQRYVIKFLYAKKFALDRIVADLASVSGEQAYVMKAVGYWIHQGKLRRSDLEDEARHDRRRLMMLTREFWHASAMSHSLQSVRLPKLKLWAWRPRQFIDTLPYPWSCKPTTLPNLFVDPIDTFGNFGFVNCRKGSGPSICFSVWTVRYWISSSSSPGCSIDWFQATFCEFVRIVYMFFLPRRTCRARLSHSIVNDHPARKFEKRNSSIGQRSPKCAIDPLLRQSWCCRSDRRRAAPQPS
jgi:hypothetical protein